MLGFSRRNPYEDLPFPEFGVIWLGFRWLLRLTWTRWSARSENASGFSSKQHRSLRAARRRKVEMHRNNTLVTSEEDCSDRPASSGFKQWAASQDKKKESHLASSQERSGVCNGTSSADGKKVTFVVEEPELLAPVLAVSGDQEEEDGWDSDDEGGDFDEDQNDGSWLTDEYLDGSTHLGRGEYGAYCQYSHEEWAEEVKAKWERVNRMVGDDLLRFLDSAVRNSPYPLSTVLIIVRSSHRSRANGPHCLARHALEVYTGIWLNSTTTGIRRQPEPITAALTWEALELAAKVTSPLVLKLLVHVFKLKTADVAPSFIETLVGDKKFRDAATLAEELDIQDRLCLEEIVTPLFVGGQGNVAEKFIGDNRSRQKKAVIDLDRLLNPHKDLTVKCNEMGLKKAQLQEKAIEKLVERLVKLYKLNPVDCHNFVDRRNLSSVRNLLYRKYTTQAQGNWEDLLEASVRGNLWLQVCLIEALALEYRDSAAALHWAKRFAVPPEALPVAVLNRVAALRDVQYFEPPNEDAGFTELALDAMASGCSEYHQLDLPDERITMVDDDRSLAQCMKDVLKHGSIVGMDSEWRPTLCTGGHARIGLLQMATSQHVYLLDMIALPKLADPKLLLQLFSGLFTSRSVVVLGYAFDGDLEMLMNSIPGVREAILPLRRVVDVRTLSEQIDVAEGKLRINRKQPLEQNGASSNSHQDEGAQQGPVYKHYTSGTGLSGLIEVCFGNPLDKSQQMSDWERRPLRPQQRTYAALDAYCLVQAFDVLTQRANELGLDPEPCMKLRNWEFARRAARLKHQQFTISEDTEALGALIRPFQLSLVADNGMLVLGRHLRCCGVNISLLPPRTKQRKIVEVAHAEKRIILTSGMPYMKFRQEVAYGRVFAVPSGQIRDQVLEVLQHFNVNVQPDDLFSRCQNCNCTEYQRIRSDDMQRIRQQVAQAASSATVPTHVNGSHGDGSNGAADTTIENGTSTQSPSPQNGHCNGGHVNGASASHTSSLQNGHHSNGDVANGHHCNGHVTNGHHSMQQGGKQKSAPVSPSDVPFVSLDKGVVVSPNGEVLLTATSTALHLDSLRAATLAEIDTFVCCCGCGLVFWEGLNSVDLRKKFQYVLDLSGQDANN
ncbi:exonuclease mut-7 homolog [Sycon ciliatum]|uniref:exonuclease mut-7 homolog n=1 Tax=Sycon ciliatum TaxID=27933 RepID=UPI0020ABFD2C|eukprot:scpid20496/ scgid10385/ Probable exonuclease mut-7 homolog; Exonuclease 3&apos